MDSIRGIWIFSGDWLKHLHPKRQLHKTHVIEVQTEKIKQREEGRKLNQSTHYADSVDYLDHNN